ncbi:hypothetical protein SYNPS1DRAFT_26796 [Syncephalis pseudoplumigaleata]|uniref:Uncharacterized protein n=1 Tax=Syncephalis pseudoplumigaleata TaxID=1712513 RepID=A0A4P9Z4Y9_9FUNG|nr:hypothetical protein SYNPS1DRAFT_26796 [Syncephalis pseudoplumigaleata]|eukprot:RKP27545.1 hypothetical protein SYNPS1DRAFT_26796 [Syncephalis pseudoplumigaleata]
MSTDIPYLQAQVTKLRGEVKALKLAAANAEHAREAPPSTSPSRAASPSPNSPTAPGISSPLSPFRFRSSSMGNNTNNGNGSSNGSDAIPTSAARRIQELETEVTRITASYQHLLVQFENICQSNTTLQQASAQNELAKHDNERRRRHRRRHGRNDSTGVSESEYGEETESEAETISSIGDRSEQSVRSGNNHHHNNSSSNGIAARANHARSHSIASTSGDGSFMAMTSFQQQVEPVIEEYEKVVAGLEAQLRETSEAIREAESELQAYKERALRAEQTQEANGRELMELRAQLQQLENAHLLYREQMADAECAQAEIERLQRRVSDLEMQLEEERDATTAAIAAASEAASRMRTPDLRADHFAASNHSGRATPVLIRPTSSRASPAPIEAMLMREKSEERGQLHESRSLPPPSPQPATPPHRLTREGARTTEDVYLHPEDGYHRSGSAILLKSRSSSRGSRASSIPRASPVHDQHPISLDDQVEGEAIGIALHIGLALEHDAPRAHRYAERATARRIAMAKVRLRVQLELGPVGDDIVKVMLPVDIAVDDKFNLVAISAHKPRLLVHVHAMDHLSMLQCQRGKRACAHVARAHREHGHLGGIGEVVVGQIDEAVSHIDRGQLAEQHVIGQVACPYHRTPQHNNGHIERGEPGIRTAPFLVQNALVRRMHLDVVVLQLHQLRGHDRIQVDGLAQRVEQLLGRHEVGAPIVVLVDE